MATSTVSRWRADSPVCNLLKLVPATFTVTRSPLRQRRGGRWGGKTITPLIVGAGERLDLAKRRR